MDIGSLRPIEEVEVKIFHPLTKEETDITFTVCGTDSKQYRQAYRDVLVKRMSDQSEGDDVDRQECEILARCVIDIKGLTIDGVEPEKTTEAITDLFVEYSWIKNQVDIFIATKSNFFLKA